MTPVTTGWDWTWVAFPVCLPWQEEFGPLSFYFPEVECGLLLQAPPAVGWRSRFQPPKYQNLPALLKGFRPGELRQWQAFLDFLASQEGDDTELRAAIRGELAPVLPPSPEPELLWSLAYQLEQVLSDAAAGLAALRRQEQALSTALGGELEEITALGSVEPSFSPDLDRTPPDLELTRLRLLFWRQLLEVEPQRQRLGLVLEPAAGANHPRWLWLAAQAEGEEVRSWRWELPLWPPSLPVTVGQAEREKLWSALGGLIGSLLRGDDPEPAAAACQELAPSLAAAAGPRPWGRLTLELVSQAPTAPGPLPPVLLVAAPVRSA